MNTYNTPSGYNNIYTISTGYNNIYTISMHYLLSNNKIMNMSSHISNINFNVKKNKKIVKVTILNNLDIFCYENIKKLVILDTINRDNFISYEIEFEEFETSVDQNNILTGILTFNIIDKYTNFKLTEMDLSSLSKEHRNLIKKELRNASLKDITKDLE